MNVPIHPGARIYAIREILRRTGLEASELDACEIEAETHEVVVRLPTPGPMLLRFPVRIEAFEHGNAGSAPFEVPECARAALGGEVTIPVPGGWSYIGASRPLVQYQGNEIRFEADVAAAVLFLLCRIEERLVKTRDEHGRFPALASFSSIEGYLRRPLVDEYSVVLRECIRTICANWRPPVRPMRVFLTHDIDDVGIPFDFRRAAGHLIRRNSGGAFAREFLAALHVCDSPYLACVRSLAEKSRELRLYSAFYWKASGETERDTGYDPYHPEVQRTLAWLKEQGFELGVHPAYDTFEDRVKLGDEVSRLQKALGVTACGGRQHYLRWSPETWLDWEACGLQYDSTVGFADGPGFRCGTCWPYFPWLIEQGRVSRLLECPLILMDVSLTNYLRLNIEEGFELAAKLIKRVELVGGVFVLLWHNDKLLEPVCGALYDRILHALSGSAAYRPLDALIAKPG